MSINVLSIWSIHSRINLVNVISIWSIALCEAVVGIMLNPRDDEDRKDGHPVSQEGQSDCVFPEHRICDSILPQFFVLCKHHFKY